MMNYPPLNELIEKAGCRYLLVTTVAKRARQLQDDREKLDDRKPVSAAVEELYNDELEIIAPEEYR